MLTRKTCFALTRGVRHFHLASSIATKIKPSAIRAVFSRALELEAQGESIVHLEVGQPNFRAPAHAIEVPTLLFFSLYPPLSLSFEYLISNNILLMCLHLHVYTYRPLLRP